MTTINKHYRLPRVVALAGPSGDSFSAGGRCTPCLGRRRTSPIVSPSVTWSWLWSWKNHQFLTSIADQHRNFRNQDPRKQESTAQGFQGPTAVFSLPPTLSKQSQAVIPIDWSHLIAPYSGHYTGSWWRYGEVLWPISRSICRFGDNGDVYAK